MATIKAYANIEHGMQLTNERAAVRWVLQDSTTVTSQCPCCGLMSWNGCDCPVVWTKWKDDAPVADDEPEITPREQILECARRTYRVLVRERRRSLPGWLAPRSRARAPVVPRRSVQRGEPLGLRNYARR